MGAHTDDARVQAVLEQLVEAAASFRCPRHDVALFVDGTKSYTVLRHDAWTTRVSLQDVLRNGSAAVRAFVSHQLLMASLPQLLAQETVYDRVWVVEEDARFSGPGWQQLFGAFNESTADLVAHVRKTNRGQAALLPVARISARLFKAVHLELEAIDARERGAPGTPTKTKKTIHGAFIYQLCKRKSWCNVDVLPREWIGVYRAKCAWSTQIYDVVAPGFNAAETHGRVFHPVKVDPPFRGREFVQFKCRDQFAKEGVPKELVVDHRKAKPKPPPIPKPGFVDMPPADDEPFM